MSNKLAIQNEFPLITKNDTSSFNSESSNSQVQSATLSKVRRRSQNFGKLRPTSSFIPIPQVPRPKNKAPPVPSSRKIGGSVLINHQPSKSLDNKSNHPILPTSFTLQPSPYTQNTKSNFQHLPNDSDSSDPEPPSNSPPSLQEIVRLEKLHYASISKVRPKVQSEEVRTPKNKKIFGLFGKPKFLKKTSPNLCESKSFEEGGKRKNRYSMPNVPVANITPDYSTPVCGRPIDEKILQQNRKQNQLFIKEHLSSNVHHFNAVTSIYANTNYSNNVNQINFDISQPFQTKLVHQWDSSDCCNFLKFVNIDNVESLCDNLLINKITGKTLLKYHCSEKMSKIFDADKTVLNKISNNLYKILFAQSRAGFENFDKNLSFNYR